MDKNISRIIQLKNHVSVSAINFANEQLEVAEVVWFQFLKRRLGNESYSYRGVFVEMGAFDGVTGSNSLFFDNVLHWSGLLIEANSVNFAQCAFSRQRAVRLEAAVCDCNRSGGVSEMKTNPCQLEFIGDYGVTSGAVTSMASPY